MTAQRTIRLTLLTLLLAATVTGCGPTKAGKEARTNARTRLDQFSAGFTYDQAVQELESGQFERASRTIMAAVQALPNDPRFYILLGRVELEQHHLERAGLAFARAIEFDPENAEPHYFAGIVSQRWSKEEEALQSYTAAADLEPDNVQYLLAQAEMMLVTGATTEAKGLIESRMTYFEYDANLRLFLGQIALLEADPGLAARLYGEARMLDPESDRLLEELMWIQWQAELYGPCLSSIGTLRDRSPDAVRPDIDRLEARCSTMVGRLDRAHHLYRNLCLTMSSDSEMWIEFGAIAWELNDIGRLGECGRRAVALAPDQFEGWLYQGLYARQRGKLDEARHLFGEAAKRTTKSALPQLLLGQLEEKLGARQAAERAYRTAVAIDPSSQEASFLLANLMRGQHARGAS